MESLTLSPLSCVDGIRLGSTRSEVHEGFGVPEFSYRKAPGAPQVTDGWRGGAVQVFYAADEQSVEFIELSRNPEVEALLFGVSVFATPATDLVALLEPKCQFRVEEAGTSYICSKLELALWRPSSDETYFATVGIGVPGYFGGGTP